MAKLVALVVVIVFWGCNHIPDVAIDASSGDARVDGAQPIVTITATVNSTRFVTREHMLAAGEMQISGEPLAEAMGRTLANYSRDRVPTDLYFDPQHRAVVDRSRGVLDRDRVVRILEAADELARVRVERRDLARVWPARQPST